MARKVFISVLGTGFYEECTYKREEFEADTTRFIQCATLQMHTRNENWTAEDHGYVLLTEKARKDNWTIDGNVRQNRKTQCNEDYVGLKDAVAALNLPFAVDGIDIPIGNTEDEIWQIFDIVFDKLQDGDELYFDITHGFRYLPMLVLVLGNYAKFLKHVKVESITYGNYEAADKKENPPVAPIIDITAFSALQDWTSAASDFLGHGDATKLAECGSSQLRPVLRETKGKDQAASNLNKLCQSVSDFVSSVKFCRGMELYQGQKSSKVESLMAGVDGKYLKPLLPLLSRVGDQVKSFKPEHAENMLLAADICAKSGNWQAAVTLLQEGIVTFFCVRYDLDPAEKREREIVNRAFIKKYLRLNGKESNYDPLPKEKEKIVDDVVNDELLVFSFVRDYANLTDVRNDINHAGMRNSKEPMKVKKLKANIEKCIDKALGLLGDSSKGVPHFFINLSNHPSSSWSREQLAAAAEYGDMVDMEFPQVEPDSTSEDIKAKAKTLIEKIMKYANDGLATVHIMGEMSLTYCLVKRLTALGICCVCSTSYRIVEEGKDGRKIVDFHFEKFRDYE